ncbi:dipeptidase [Fusibacter ferrireducens]|uniref:Membrane dipeptidase n=1 Tax=Fusibacter ferrireducens TaxID=2785058 RepID=A0ABR9ZY63_9FIRM|nr:membrane dipeptidase [Fusibacter ferrireducens]MBF4695410.1 membrane dipeptidase [Fusibacter ferrireducens]
MIFDGHSDLLIALSKQRQQGQKNVFKSFYYDQYRASSVYGGIFVLWADPPNDIHPKERIDHLLNVALNEIEDAQGLIRLITKFSDLDMKDTNHFQVLLGMEGLSHLKNDISLLDGYYDQGVRHASLTWNDVNEFATSVLGDPTRGLTPSGIEAVERMEQLGMIVDVSHLNEKSFWDVANHTHKPFIASHSNARSVCDHKRNLTDDQLKAVSASGGLVGLNCYGDFVSASKSLQTLEGMGIQINHLLKTIGPDHIALGFDFCDYLEADTLGSFSDTPLAQPGINGLNNISEVKNLTAYLYAMGLSENVILKITHRNYERFLREVL